MSGGLRSDALKIKKATAGAYGVSAGYLIVYTEVHKQDAADKMNEKLGKWAQELGLSFLNKDRSFLKSAEDWTAGYGLFRTV